MKKSLLLILASLMLVSMSFAQDGKIIRRIKIRSADPYFIAMMLAGHQNYNLAPETSTILKTNLGGGSNGGGSGSFGGSGSGSGGFGSGSGSSGFGSGGRNGG